MLYTYVPKYGLPANSMSLKTPILKGVDVAVVFAKRVKVKSYRHEEPAGSAYSIYCVT